MINTIKPAWSAPSNVKAYTTTRQGGISDEPFASLNVGDHVQDNPQHVTTNRATVHQQLQLPAEPIWLEQTHSTDIIDISNSAYQGKPIAGDGAFSANKAVVCAIMTADCLPLFVCNKQGNKVAAIHAGWRGMADGIIERAIELFNEPADNILAWSGPTISQQHFEVGKEVQQALAGPDSAYQASTTDNSKVYADLYEITRYRLERLGINDYGYYNGCTYQDQQQFFSYRRDGQTGRMVSLIWME